MRGTVNDNTLGTNYGAYLAFDMTSTTASSSRAVLISPDLDNVAQYCFQYYYRGYGNGQANLKITRQAFGNVNQSYVLVNHGSSDFTSDWKVNQIALKQLLNQTSNVYRLLFEAISINGIGRLMLDDFSLINGPCPSLPSNCSIQCETQNGTQCISTSQICDFNVDCVSGDDERMCGYNCNFETDQCNYTDPSAGFYKWRRQVASLALPGTNSGPINDHTTLTQYGYYMIVLTNNGTIDERAQLLSPLLQQSAATCELTFYYHMRGVNVGRLEVLLIQGSETSRVFTLEGSQANRWLPAVIKIGRLYRPFQVRFDVKKTATTLADIAIDDIQWLGCNLPVIDDPTVKCADNQFSCTRGGCIDQNRVCDYTDDCGDKSDEDSSMCTRPAVIPG